MSTNGARVCKVAEVNRDAGLPKRFATEFHRRGNGAANLLIDDAARARRLVNVTEVTGAHFLKQQTKPRTDKQARRAPPGAV